ncbi:hypothetical protein EMIT0111MI5_80083 [Burkholderia sp. IT-111MI5]
MDEKLLIKHSRFQKVFNSNKNPPINTI